MKQTTLSVTLEVKPESFDRLSSLIDQLHDRYPDADASYASFMTGVPSVHFMSMSVFPGAEYDPLFVLEANFDGSKGVFWGQLEAAIGNDLRAILRCCKRPLDQDGALFDAVTTKDSRAPVAPYFEVRTRAPTVFHHGNRGLTRDRILDEAKLFSAVREELSTANGFGPSPYRDTTAAAVHGHLRNALLPAFSWLDQTPPARFPLLERLGDIARLARFVVLVVLALALPGLILTAFMPVATFVWVILGLFVLIATGIYKLHEPLPGTATNGKLNLLNLAVRFPITFLLVFLLGLAVVAPCAAVLAWAFTEVPNERLWDATIQGASLAVLSVILVVLPGLVLWLRWLERQDSSHDAPPIDEDMMRQMAQREDWIPQNHMGSAVLIRPGVLRMIVIRAGHLGLGLLLRVKATDGYLGSMRTVHFAHWAMANNKSRLLFFSNFDQSWESYLDDFIEKAHEGLTLAWGCGVGFPATRFLIQDGASHGRRFKAWARHSMTVSRFWYSAYPNLTVDQIERNNRLANGLRSKTLTEKEASAWLHDL